MSLKLYMDVHIPRAITEGLRLRGVDILTAQEDARHTASDASLMDRATSLGWVIFSQDQDMLAEAASRHRKGTPFSGLIFAHSARLSIGDCVRDLELLSKTCAPDEFNGRVEYLPL